MRLERHYASGLKLAHALHGHPALASLHYPPLPSDPGHALWQRYFRLGNSWGAVHVGLEDADDLLRDVMQALDSVPTN